MDLVGVEGHWTLTEHAMFRQNVLRDGVAKSCICPFRQVLRHSGTTILLLPRPLGRGRIPQARASGPPHSSPLVPFVFPAPGVGPPLGAGGWAPPSTFPA